MGNLLLSQELVSEISELIYPFTAGRKSYKMLSDIEKNFKLEHIKKTDSG